MDESGQRKRRRGHEGQPALARLPRRAQELIGYAAHDAITIGGGYLGAIDLQSPVDLLASGQL